MNKKLYILLAFLILISTIRYEKRAIKRKFSDFHVVYITGKRFLNHEEIYTFKGNVSYFKYPPFYAFLLSPLSIPQEKYAALVWYLLNWLFLILSFYYGIRLIDKNPIKIKPIYFLTFIASFRFILENLDQGQANILMMCLTTLGLYCFSIKKENLSALYLSVATLTKYFPILFLPYFLFKKKFKFSFKIILFLIILYFIPALAIGWHNMLILAKKNILFLFKSSLDKYSITCFPNQSLLAFLMRLFSKNQWYPTQFFILPDNIIYLIFISLSIFLYIIAIYPKNKHIINYSSIFLCFSLLNPNAWKNFFLFMFFPNMLIIYYLLNWGKNRIILSLFLLSFIFSSLTSEFFVYRWAKDWFEIHSFVTVGAILLFLVLIKIKNHKDFQIVSSPQ
jgi:hypothetical protein